MTTEIQQAVEQLGHEDLDNIWGWGETAKDKYTIVKCIQHDPEDGTDVGEYARGGSNYDPEYYSFVCTKADFIKACNA